MITLDYRPPYYNDFLRFKEEERSRGVVSNIDYEDFLKMLEDGRNR